MVNVWSNVCCVCSKCFKYCGNMSNMWLHLSTVHSSQFASMEKEENVTDMGVQQQRPAMFEVQRPIT